MNRSESSVCPPFTLNNFSIYRTCFFYGACTQRAPHAVPGILPSDILPVDHAAATNLRIKL